MPSVGLAHLVVGRSDYYKTLKREVATIGDGLHPLRIVMGHFGSGKTFLMQLIKQWAIREGYVTVDADLLRGVPLRRGTSEQQWRELLLRASTVTMPDGGAIEAILDGFVRQPDVSSRRAALTRHPGGGPWADLLRLYADAKRSGDQERVEACLKWLRDEFRTDRQEKDALGVGARLNVAGLWQPLRLLAAVATGAGYKGLLVCLDEAARLCDLHHQSRKNSYAELLDVLNDRSDSRIGLFLAATPHLIDDETRGLRSDGAVWDRVKFTVTAKPHEQTILMLDPLDINDQVVALERIALVQALGDADRVAITRTGIQEFLRLFATHTLRERVKEFAALLARLETEPDWRSVLAEIAETMGVDPGAAAVDDELTSVTVRRKRK